MSNLLPLQHKKAVLGLYRKRYLALLLLACASLGVVATALLAPSYLYLRSSVLVLRSKRDTLAGYETSTIATKLAATVTDINSRLKVFPAVSPASPLVAGLLDPLLRAKSPAIRISEFAYSPGVTSLQAKVKVSGIADSRTDLLAFSDKVQSLGTFTSVSVPIASYIKDTDIPFTLSAVVVLKP